jgi:hypothetical protein
VTDDDTEVLVSLAVAHVVDADAVERVETVVVQLAIDDTRDDAPNGATRYGPGASRR